MGDNPRITAVGDDDQCIYSFRFVYIQDKLIKLRGTSPTIFSEFETYFHNCCVKVLDINYRSTKNIVNCANSLIEKNNLRQSKSLKSNKDAGSKLKIIR